MKKICSVILSCALLLGLLVVPGVAAEPQQIFQGFEDEYNWGGAHVAGTFPFSRYTKTEESDSFVRTGDSSLYFDGNGANGVISLTDKAVSLPAGKTYTLEMYVKRATANANLPGGDDGYLGIVGAGDKSWGLVNAEIKRIEYSVNFPTDSWRKLIVTFTTKKAYSYIGLQSYGKIAWYADDITLTELAPVTVDFKEADGTVIDQRMGLPGSALTLPRTPEKEGYSFDGWYKDADFTTAFTGTTFPTASTTLYAKFKDVSINYSYETETNKLVWDAGDVDCTVDNELMSDGTQSFKITSVNRGMGNVLLTPNTDDYTLTKGKAYKVSIDVNTAYHFDNFTIGAATNTWQVNGYKVPNIFKVSIPAKANTWQTITGEFVANGEKLYLFFNSWTTPSIKKDAYFHLDNLKITPITAQTNLEKAVAAELEYQGSSLRPEDAEKKANPISGNNGEAAIRFKSKISNKLLNEGITVSEVHYSVVEYGHTYFREDLMGGNTVLDIGTTYTSGKAAKNAVAYRKENGAVTTDIWFSKDETNVTYTAALYNFTEQSYTLTYVARPYVKLVADNSTKEITVYGANTQFAAFNDVADRAFYAHPGDVYDRAAAYTDVNGDSWSESYEIRSALYNTVLSKLSGQGFNYLAPAAAAE